MEFVRTLEILKLENKIPETVASRELGANSRRNSQKTAIIPGTGLRCDAVTECSFESSWLNSLLLLLHSTSLIPRMGSQRKSKKKDRGKISPLCNPHPKVGLRLGSFFRAAGPPWPCRSPKILFAIYSE